MVTRIEIELREPSKRGRFDDIILHLYNESEHYSTNINFDFNPLYSFSKDTDTIAFDFLLFSVLIYNIDRFINRNIFSLEGWTREIEVINMPVQHLDEFNSKKTEIDDAVSFLTGDNWDINYTLSDGIFYQPKLKIKEWEDINVFDKVSLFSGGLDSLIGAIDELEQLSKGKKLLLISHKDLGKEGKDQENILDVFTQRQLYNDRYDQIQTSVGIGRRNIGRRLKREATFRSRSLLFIGMGIYVAYNISSDTPLIIPENGTIALNIPLMPSRRSACSTRTTHPTFLNQLQVILQSMGITNSINNPYEFKTKGEMVIETLNSTLLGELSELSCSCAKRGHTSNWDRRGGNIRHCGMCLPCIYRRVALHRIGMDDEVVGTNLFNPQKYPLEKLPDVPAFLDYMRNPLSIEDIEKNLLINGTLPLNKVEQYASVVFRTRSQVIDWIKDKGSVEIKKKLGIQ